MTRKNFYTKRTVWVLCLTLILTFGILLTACEFNSKEPVEDAAASILTETRLIPGGQSVGVKMDVSGVLVVGLEEIEGEDGKLTNPGLNAGLELGDRILEIDGISVNSPEEVQESVNIRHSKVNMKIKRGEQTFNVNITPVKAAVDGRYKIGVWVRDKTAGLGTLTYYNPETEGYGALGHAITDPDTGDVLPVEKGVLLNARVESVKQGTAGNPGAIRGVFYEAEDPIGQLSKNSAYGIFGTLYNPADNPFYPNPLPLASQAQVEEGPAYILCTLEGDKLERFEIKILRVNHQKRANGKSMVIKVTDSNLLEKTGGIVQGMSGSPIIQNDRIVGAVTHVMVNDPTRGYGVFIEWMLETAVS